MTVGELKEALKDIPDNLKVLAEGEEADRVIVEDEHYIRIFKSWDMNLVMGSAGIRTCADCILNRTVTCIRGAERAIDNDEICEVFIPLPQE